MKLYYWRGRRPNFGDELAPHLLHLAGIMPTRSTPAEADVVVIGSIAEHLPVAYTGIVAGIGKAHERTELKLHRANVLALRGPLTLRDSGARGDVVLGDPGLLAPRLLANKPQTTHKLGVVPHYADRLLARHFPGHVIDVTRPVLEVIAAIASCERIVTSSLHGLIVADALHRPRRWELYAGVQGGGFKFRDYGLALGEDLRPGQWRAARASRVDDLQASLIDVFDGLAREAQAAA